MTAIDWLILGLYFAFVLGIGVALKGSMKTSTDFFLAGRAIPAWVAGLGFMSANLGAQEVIGMGASGAKYGIATSHFRADAKILFFFASCFANSARTGSSSGAIER